MSALLTVLASILATILKSLIPVLVDAAKAPVTAEEAKTNPDRRKAFAEAVGKRKASDLGP
jgi:hypothetical protein